MGAVKKLNNINPYKFVIRDTEHLIDVLKSLRLSKSMAIDNIKRYGYIMEMDYILEALGFNSTGTGKIKLPNYIKEQAKLFNILFSVDKECFIRLRNKDTGEYRTYNVEALQDPYRLNAILKSQYFSNLNDMMYTLNCYNNMYSATTESLFSLQNFALDIDFPTEKFMVNEVINIITDLYKNDVIPTPNVIEYGHRIRLIYSIEDVASNKKSRNKLNYLAEKINSLIPKELNSSVQLLTTYGRVIGTNNTKDNSKIKVKIINPVKYVLRELADKWLGAYEVVGSKPTTTKKPKKQINDKSYNKVIKKKDGTILFQNQYSLNVLRLEDLEKIQEKFERRNRELLCFFYRNQCHLAGFSQEEAFEMTLRFNDNFEFPLTENEVKRDTKNTLKKKYNLKNTYILNKLGIEPEQEVELKLKTILSEEEYKRRDREYQKEKYNEKLKSEGKLTKKEQNEIIRKKIKNLREEGFKIEDIALQLGIGVSTAKRHITFMKKNGLL